MISGFGISGAVSKKYQLGLVNPIWRAFMRTVNEIIAGLPLGRTHWDHFLVVRMQWEIDIAQGRS